MNGTRRDPENRSRKACCCGGHSSNDHKKSKQHHGTARRLAYRRSRQHEQKRRTMNQDQLAALSETALIDTICQCGVRNGMTHPDISGLVDELARRRGISKSGNKAPPEASLEVTTAATMDPVPVNFGEDD